VTNILIFGLLSVPQRVESITVCLYFHFRFFTDIFIEVEWKGVLRRKTQVPHVFFAVLRASLPLILLWDTNVAKLITLHVYCSQVCSTYFIKHSPYRKAFQIKFALLNEVYIFLVPVILRWGFIFYIENRSISMSASCKVGVILDRYKSKLNFLDILSSFGNRTFGQTDLHDVPCMRSRRTFCA